MVRSRSRHRRPRVPHDGRCSYCDRSFGSLVLWKNRPRHITVHFDHLRPWAAGGSDRADNIVASCNLCNIIKGSQIFGSFAEAKLYVVTELEKRGAITLWEADCKSVPELECERCHKPFLSYHSRARFCSDRCRYSEWDEQNPRYSIKEQRFKSRAEALEAEDAEWAAWVSRDRTAKAERRKYWEQERAEARTRADARRKEAEKNVKYWKDQALKWVKAAKKRAEQADDPNERRRLYELMEWKCRLDPWLKEYLPWMKLPNTAVRRRGL